MNVQTLASLLGTTIAAFIGVLGAIATAYFGFLDSDRGHDIRMVEISLSILRGEGDREMSLPARRYAIKALQQFSGVTVSHEDAKEWAETGVTPFRPVTSVWNPLFDPSIECEPLQTTDRLECLFKSVGRMKSFNDAFSEAMRGREAPDEN